MVLRPSNISRWDWTLVKDMVFNASKDLSEAYDRAKSFIAIEEAMGSLK